MYKYYRRLFKLSPLWMTVNVTALEGITEPRTEQRRHPQQVKHLSATYNTHFQA